MKVLRLINSIGFILWIGLVFVDNSNFVRCFSVNRADQSNEYTREWAARISDPLEADLIAIETGFVNRGPIEPFHDIYLFENLNVPHRGKRHAQEHTDRLLNHEKVNIIDYCNSLTFLIEKLLFLRSFGQSNKFLDNALKEITLI